MQKAFLIILVIYGLSAGLFAQAQSTSTISATVPDIGQGTAPAPNVAVDQTEDFEVRYGAHTSSDIITSDLLLWIFLLFLLVILTIVMLELDEYRIHKGIKLDVHSKK